MHLSMLDPTSLSTGIGEALQGINAELSPDGQSFELSSCIQP